MRSDWQALVSDLVESVRAVPVSQLVSPDRLPEQRAVLKQALMRNETTVPTWTFPATNLAAAKRHLARVSASSHLDHPLIDFVRREADALVEAVRAFTERSDRKVVDWSLRTHDQPSAETVTLAWELLTQRDKESVVEAGEVSATDAARRIRETLDHYDLRGWRVEVSAELVPRMSIRPLDRHIRVRGDISFTSDDLRRLVVHEVGSHVLRSANAQAQPEPLAAVSLGSPVPTEEGFAAWHENKFGVSNPQVLRTYAARVVAVNLAENQGIVGVARSLEPYVGLDVAAEIAVRVKRGLTDPNRPGAYYRDHGYLTGVIRVSDHLAVRPDDYAALMATKWPLDMLPTVTELLDSGQLDYPGLLPDEHRLGLVQG